MLCEEVGLSVMLISVGRNVVGGAVFGKLEGVEIVGTFVFSNMIMVCILPALIGVPRKFSSTSKNSVVFASIQFFKNTS